ncbi:MAG: Gfo/Idh/MocA family oxidoreductase [Proteobacteria bacterium]|nr:Gfo/Idh/MocA family oxidoreductase [Pseudomonadota bacterium]
MKRVGVGIIGCGNISEAYLKAAPGFPILDIRGLADIRAAAAEARANAFGLKAMSIEALLDDPSIELVINLTIPVAHVEVSLRAIEAGKHVHSEKPLGIATAEAKRLLNAAAKRKLRVGCAPDTFLGGAHQTCRKLVDDGAIGRPVAATAFFMCPGHERWHPNPAFYYQAGGGPMLDMGPYYITALVNLLGPVAAVSGATARAKARRTITSEPLKGKKIPVNVATHVAGTLEFASGAMASMAMSFDVPKHRHLPIELYGTEASLIVPDPNRFGGEIMRAKAGAEWETMPTQHGYADGNYRIIGAADMAHAILSGRRHRASGELAYHVLEVMEAFQISQDKGRRIAIKSQPPRPAMLPVGFKPGTLG